MASSSVPDHRILHISDTRLLTDSQISGENIDCGDAVARLLDEVEEIDDRPEALVLTGTLPNGYRTDRPRFRSVVERAAERVDIQVIWGMGDHGGGATPGELDNEVHDVNGLRLIAVNSNVSGRLHGEVDEAQLAWLRSVLAAPAPHGSILVLHHPPVPTPDPLMEMGELTNQDALESAVVGSDLRTILAGHLHYSTLCTFAGATVSVAAASCYTQDLGIDWDSTGQAHLVRAFGNRIVNAAVRLGRHQRPR
ncbi:3',5'-cyclic-nucleotide phosphodiesterase [Rhodococcus wratislaviensis]|uniref:3',5'-cyclic-nucleotide phosphodiesterase n=1 Tax=Rhodococcus wratislaviensis TaxID=44752 RepID=A0A402CD71_RHOWR|nr:metallophosphoesterase [Rhodococcus wratislaviensis]GCE41538.1 3',5'-cyclic-nucleotide phosphodiesterase [Rhodococcus wratislaviensis]